MEGGTQHPEEAEEQGRGTKRTAGRDADGFNSVKMHKKGTNLEKNK